jgi:hypothetical protein
LAESVTAELVARYVAAGESAASSEIEEMALLEAGRIVREMTFLGDQPIYLAASAEPDADTMKDEASSRRDAPEFRQVTIESWKRVILKQLHIALCQRSRRYRSEVNDLKKNGKLLIAAITGYVAAKVGAAAAVIAALVAALLRFAISMGISAFCEWSGRLVSK